MSKGKHTEDLVIGIALLTGGIYGYFTLDNQTIGLIMSNIGSVFCGWWVSNWDKYRKK